jgi:copper chaperone
METAAFNIPSISCSVCSNKIQGELKGMNGIENLNIDLKTQTLNVSYNPDELKSQDIGKKIASMGYEVIQ